MSAIGSVTQIESSIYECLNIARSYLRRLDDFYAKAAAGHNTTFEHYQVLLALHCLDGKSLTLRVLAEHLVRDRTATGQLCKRMQQLDLLELTYESNSHRPQLLVSINEHGSAVLKAITEDGLRDRDRYLSALPAQERMDLAAAVRSSWLDGLESSPARSSQEVSDR
jgi:DNA-binding MarR family transcriptional regulator